MHCARCSKAGMIEIRLRVAERDLTFRRCGRCEAQTWETADGPVPLVHVLELRAPADTTELERELERADPYERSRCA